MSDCLSVYPFVRPFHMSRSNLRTPWPIHFRFHRVIGIDGLTVCILFGEISFFHSRVMGLYSSNCRRFFVCRAVNWECLGRFTSNFAQLLELIILQSVYFLVKFWFFIPELWDLNYYSVLFKHKYCISCWWNLDFSFKSYGKESLYKYCMNVDEGRIIRSWRSCLFTF